MNEEGKQVEATTFVSSTVATNTYFSSVNNYQEQKRDISKGDTASIPDIATTTSSTMSTANENKKMLTQLVVDPLLRFLGLNAVREAWGVDEVNKYTSIKWLHAFLAFLGLANVIDTILDLVTSSLEILKINQCEESSNTLEAFILFIMTLVAGCVRSVSGKIQLKNAGGAKEIEKEPLTRMFKIVMFESIVFVIEDGASILFLASRKCTGILDIISLSFTIISLLSICLHFICLSILKFLNCVCGLKVEEVYVSIFTFFYSFLFNMFYVYQIFIAITKIIMPYSERNEDEDRIMPNSERNKDEDREDLQNLPTFIVYWVGVVVLSVSLIIIIVKYFEMIPSEEEQRVRDRRKHVRPDIEIQDNKNVAKQETQVVSETQDTGD